LVGKWFTCEVDVVVSSCGDRRMSIVFAGKVWAEGRRLPDSGYDCVTLVEFHTMIGRRKRRRTVKMA
jgi:hypothetical protein